MADIVERLQSGNPGIDSTYPKIMAEAADEIERLREWNREIALNAREFAADNERLRAALRGVVRVADRDTAEFNEARTALEER